MWVNHQPLHSDPSLTFSLSLHSWTSKETLGYHLYPGWVLYRNRQFYRHTPLGDQWRCVGQTALGPSSCCRRWIWRWLWRWTEQCLCFSKRVFVLYARRICLCVRHFIVCVYVCVCVTAVTVTIYLPKKMHSCVSSSLDVDLESDHFLEA